MMGAHGNVDDCNKAIGQVHDVCEVNHDVWNTWTRFNETNFKQTSEEDFKAMCK